MDIIFTRWKSSMTIQRTSSILAFRVSLMLAFLVVHASGACVSIHGEQRQIIDAREILNSQESIVDCLRFSLQRGNTALARSIVELYDSQHQKAMQRVVEEELLRLKQLQAEVVQSESTCQPVVKWGQNMTHLFVSLKMSHRWDSPPCLNTKHQSTHSSAESLNYTNVCLVANSKITFSFLLQFYDQVAPHSHPITFLRDGVGIYSAIIEKAQTKVWPFLARDEKSYPIWSEISERHNSVHKEYETLLSGILRARKSKPVVLDEPKKETEADLVKTQGEEIVQVEEQPTPAKDNNEEIVPETFTVPNDEQTVVQPVFEDGKPVDLLSLKS